MSDAAAPLTTEEYGQLYGMLKSEDADVRAQAKALASKLTPAEEKSFFDYQKSQQPKGVDATANRADSNIASVGGIGIAPEDALMAGRAVRGVVGATKAGGVMAGVKQAVATADPIVKFEVARRSLQAIGVPPDVAVVLAYGISGYKGKGGAKTPAAASPSDAPHLDLSSRVRASSLTQEQIAERLAAVRANGMNAPTPGPTYAPRPGPSSAPTPAPSAPSIAEAAATPTKSPQWALNNIAIQARRLGVKLTEAEAEQIRPAVQSGVDPAEAVAGLKQSPSIADIAADPAAEFAKRFNLPTDDERRWPVNKVGLPSNPPKADAKYRRAK